MRLATLAAMLVPLAGCLGGSGSSSGADLVDPMPTQGIDATLDNASLPTLGDPVDLWRPEEVERLLLQADVDVDPAGCTPGPTTLGTVWSGCSDFYLPDGVVVPEGTRTLRIEGDASGARRAGSWNVYILNTHGRAWVLGERWAEGVPTTEATNTWRFDLEPRDWDVDADRESAFAFHLMGSGGTANALQGIVKVKVWAERDPAWTPLPPVDHWQLVDLHAIPEPGVITLFDDVYAFRQPGSASTTVPTVFPPLRDVVPMDAKQVVIGATLSQVTGCPPTDSCNFRTPMFSGGKTTTLGDAASDTFGAGWRVLTYDVPDMASPDGPYVEASSTMFFPWIDDCLPTEVTPACSGQFPNDISANLRIIVEAWKGPVDVASVKARLGVQ